MPEDRTILPDTAATVVSFEIKINNVAIPLTIAVESIFVQKELNRIPVAKVVLIDGNPAEEQFETSDGNLFIPGNEIEILAGYDSDNKTLFKGLIVKQQVKIRSNNSILIVECRDKIIQATGVKKNKYFSEGVKDSDIFSELLRPYNLGTDIQATDINHKQIIQYQSTDWDFILTRADVAGKVVIADDGNIQIKEPDLNSNPIISLVYGATILELDADIDARYQYKKVLTRSWSSDDQAITEVEISDPGIQLNGNIEAGDLSKVMDAEQVVLQHGGDINSEELQTWGSSFWEKHQAAKVRGRVKFKGTEAVKPGKTIELSGVGDRFNGKCFVGGIRHFISAGEWQTDAQLGVDPEWFSKNYNNENNPAAGLVPGITGLQIGIVTQLEGDPDGKNRIKLYLPIINKDEQGCWARVCTLDAGQDRGSFFLPEISDEVIVGFLNDDPREAIVLGMLNSSAKPAPLTASDDNHEKGFVTRSKMKMIFNDEKSSFTLETPKGKFFILDDDAGIIKLEDDFGNKIILDQDGINIESSKDMKLKASNNYNLEALKIESKANTTLRAEGSAGAEFVSSSTVTIQGAIVRIN